MIGLLWTDQDYPGFGRGFFYPAAGPCRPFKDRACSADDPSVARFAAELPYMGGGRNRGWPEQHWSCARDYPAALARPSAGNQAPGTRRSGLPFNHPIEGLQRSARRSTVIVRQARCLIEKSGQWTGSNGARPNADSLALRRRTGNGTDDPPPPTASPWTNLIRSNAIPVRQAAERYTRVEDDVDCCPYPMFVDLY